MVIDFHSHTSFSDGELIASELVRQAAHRGYKGIAITDHGDYSNIDLVIPRIVKVCRKLSEGFGIMVMPGIELTHIPPMHIAELADESRKLGAKVIVVHGETISEPVCAGTNIAALKADIDILAHPGLITPSEVKIAAQRGIYLEITSRRGGCLTNGHVAALARQFDAPLIVNSDTHAPSELLCADEYHRVARGAGLSDKEIKKILKNALALAKRAMKQ